MKKLCEYGVYDCLCGEPAVTKRQRPSGGAEWNVCQRHADFLDRVRASIAKHRPLLEMLGDE